MWKLRLLLFNTLRLFDSLEYVRSKCKRIRNMLAWDWLYEWMIKQAAQAGFYMTSSPNITGFFCNSENRFVKWSEETIENEYTSPNKLNEQNHN